MNNVTASLLRKRLMELEQLGADAASNSLKTGGSDGTYGGMDDTGRLDKIDSRLTALEGEQRTHIRWTVTTALGIAALVVASTGFLMSRIDRTDDRLTRVEANITELPGKLTSSLNQVNQTLLQAVTASKQQPPQVIVYPTPLQAIDRSKPNEPTVAPVPMPHENK